MSTSTPTLTRLRALTEDLTDSERYRLLADDCRRLVLTVLHERGRPMHIDDLAAAVVTATDGPDTDAEAPLDRARVTLHHKQLPMLADFGVLTYDPESGRVEL